MDRTYHPFTATDTDTVNTFFWTSRFPLLIFFLPFMPLRSDRLRTAISFSREEALGPLQAHKSQIRTKHNDLCKANYKYKKKEPSYLKIHPYPCPKPPPHRYCPPIPVRQPLNSPP